MKEYLRKHIFFSIFVLFLMIFATILASAASFQLSELVNILSVGNVNQIMRAILLYVAFQGGSIVVMFIYNYFEAGIKKHIRMNVRNKIIDNTVGLSSFEYRNWEENHFLDIHINNMMLYSQAYIDNLFNGIYYFFVVITGVIMFAFLEPMLCVLLAFALVTACLISVYYEKMIDKITANYIVSKEKYNEFMDDIISGFFSFYSFRSGMYFLKKGEEKIYRYENALQKYKFKIKWMGIIIYIPTFLIDFLIISFIAIGTIGGKIEIGTLAAYLNIGGLIINAGESLFYCLISMKSGKHALKDSVYEYVPKKVDCNVSIEYEKSKNEFLFSNLQYAVDGKVLLASKSFSIQQGDKILITGLNGCGKTTFLKILDKMYEIQDGMVYFNGVDYHAMTEEEVRSRISFLKQESYIYEGTLYDNIFFDETISEAKIDEIIKISQLSEFVKNSRNGMQEILCTENLSGGEKRRVCIARLIANAKEVLLLDEPFAGMDANNFRNIEAYFLEKFPGTIIMVTHDEQQLRYKSYKKIVF